MVDEEKTLEEGEEKEPSKEEEKEFEPPVRSARTKEEQPEPEEKRFWYALRQIGKEIKEIKESVGRREDRDEFGEDVFGEKPKKDNYPEVLEDIDKRNAAVLDEIDRRDREREVRDFIRENPQFKPFQGKIEKTALHPKFVDISVDFIAKGFAFEEAERIGAEKGRNADDAADQTRTGGTSFKPSKPVAKDYLGMSDEDFEKEVARAKRSDY